MTPFDKVTALHWYKFTVIAALAGLAIWIEPKLSIGFLAGAFTSQIVKQREHESKPE